MNMKTLHQPEQVTAHDIADERRDEGEGDGVAQTLYLRTRKINGGHVKHRFARSVHDGGASAYECIRAERGVYVFEDGQRARARKRAEQQKLGLVERMETEMRVEALVKAKGFEDAIVTMSDEGVNVVVGAGEVTDQQRMQIYDIIQSETEFSAGDVKIIPYA